MVDRMKCLVAVVVLLATFAYPISAQETEGTAENEITSPSPDGQFAFLEAAPEVDDRSVDLIEKKSGKVLLRVVDESRGWSVLWAPDSKRFAIMLRLGHPVQEIAVYFRDGDTFREIELPELPEANIPERLRRGKRFPHVAALNYATADAWKKDGSLVVKIETMIDGEGASVSATRTVVLGFNRSGKAAILKSTIKFGTAND